jgi:AAA domain-containing protein/Rad51 protein
MSAMTWDTELPAHIFRLRMQPLAEIKPAPVDWIWPRYLAAGTVTTLSGEAGAGKTYVALAIAAALTNGKLPNDNRKRRVQEVVYFNGGDSPSQILRPRFDALGGDARHLHLLHFSLEPLPDEDDEDDEEEEVKPPAPVLSKKQREAAKLAAEQTLQRLVELGHTDGLNARELRAIDPKEYCDTADACPASCTKCENFESLISNLGYLSRTDLNERCDEEEEDEAYEKERSEREHERGGLSRTMEALAEALQKTKARLLIVDTLDSLLETVEAMGSGRGGSAEERADALRQLVAKLAALAEQHACCVLLIRQVSARRRGRTSRRDAVDFSDLTPIELLAGCSAQDASQRVLRMSRSRIGPLGPPLGYQINDDGTLSWNDKIEEPAPGTRAPSLSMDQQHALGEAKEFLKVALKQGRPAALDVLQQARQLGISVRTLRRAKAWLQVASERAEDGAWRWFMPT